MSSATDIILSISCIDDERRGDLVTPGMAHFRAWCEDKAIHDSVGNHEIRWPTSTGSAGGYKPIGRAIYTFCVNYLDDQGFLTAVAAAPWHYPNLIQVLFRHENDNLFRMYWMDRDRNWTAVHPPTEEWWPRRSRAKFVPLAKAATEADAPGGFSFGTNFIGGPLPVAGAIDEQARRWKWTLGAVACPHCQRATDVVQESARSITMHCLACGVGATMALDGGNDLSYVAVLVEAVSKMTPRPKPVDPPAKPDEPAGDGPVKWREFT